MAIHTFSSRDFTRDVSSAKRATANGPVFITDRGRPAYALLKIDDYYRMSSQPQETLLDVMNGIRCEPGIDFDPAPLKILTQSLTLK